MQIPRVAVIYKCTNGHASGRQALYSQVSFSQTPESDPNFRSGIELPSPFLFHSICSVRELCIFKYPLNACVKRRCLVRNVISTCQYIKGDIHAPKCANYRAYESDSRDHVPDGEPVKRFVLASLHFIGEVLL